MANLKQENSNSHSASSPEAIRKLDVIIYLLAKSYMNTNKIQMRKVISEFHNIGLKDGEIANIFGKSKSYISSELTQIKKSSFKTSKDKING